MTEFFFTVLFRERMDYPVDHEATNLPFSHIQSTSSIGIKAPDLKVWASQVAQMVKNLPIVLETQVQSLCPEE